MNNSKEKQMDNEEDQTKIMNSLVHELLSGEESYPDLLLKMIEDGSITRDLLSEEIDLVELCRLACQVGNADLFNHFFEWYRQNCKANVKDYKDSYIWVNNLKYLAYYATKYSNPDIVLKIASIPIMKHYEMRNLVRSIFFYNAKPVYEALHQRYKGKIDKIVSENYGYLLNRMFYQPLALLQQIDERDYLIAILLKKFGEDKAEETIKAKAREWIEKGSAEYPWEYYASLKTIYKGFADKSDFDYAMRCGNIEYAKEMQLHSEFSSDVISASLADLWWDASGDKNLTLEQRQKTIFSFMDFLYRQEPREFADQVKKQTRQMTKEAFIFAYNRYQQSMDNIFKGADSRSPQKVTLALSENEKDICAVAKNPVYTIIGSCLLVYHPERHIANLEIFHLGLGLYMWRNDHHESKLQIDIISHDDEAWKQAAATYKEIAENMPDTKDYRSNIYIVDGGAQESIDWHDWLNEQRRYVMGKAHDLSIILDSDIGTLSLLHQGNVTIIPVEDLCPQVRIGLSSFRYKTHRPNPKKPIKVSP